MFSIRRRTSSSVDWVLLMSGSMFTASYTKLERARRFIAELGLECQAYLDGNNAKAFIDPSQNPPQITMECNGVGEMPGAIVGDAVHNIRSSLDLMASELARIRDKNPNDVYFPFAASEDDLLANKKFVTFKKKAGDDCAELLLSLKPYRGGNDLLRALHELDNQDKHSSLILMPGKFGITFSGSYDLTNLANHNFTAVVKSLTFAFPEGTSLVGLDAFETLENLVQAAIGILEAFTSLVAARQ